MAGIPPLLFALVLIVLCIYFYRKYNLIGLLITSGLIFLWGLGTLVANPVGGNTVIAMLLLVFSAFGLFRCWKIKKSSFKRLG